MKKIPTYHIICSTFVETHTALSNSPLTVVNPYQESLANSNITRSLQRNPYQEIIAKSSITRSAESYLEILAKGINTTVLQQNPYQDILAKGNNTISLQRQNPYQDILAKAESISRDMQRLTSHVGRPPMSN
ncbi:hypothetical protein DPMN_158326 [Dreissena polymorpha]|uniref:Uncharacterized protein n=1 Tax=Dreissena polymorpha TaxID=45954 RepID=A0A9D4EM43_DREPO|nr:hypothetical protein DPMN_158326 [Dreissena polymorpha]